jgi:hypothetical protein
MGTINRVLIRNGVTIVGKPAISAATLHARRALLRFGRVPLHRTRRNVQGAKLQGRRSVVKATANRHSGTKTRGSKKKISPKYPAITGREVMGFANTAMLAATATKAPKETKAQVLRRRKFPFPSRRS